MWVSMDKQINKGGHACTHTQHTHYICTHRHTEKAKQKKAKSLAAAKQSCQPSEELGCLGTTQTLRASADKSI